MWFRVIHLFILFYTCMAIHAAAQKPSGMLVGNVQAAEGLKPIENATVQLFRIADSSSALQSKRTDKNGFFQLTEVPVGYFWLQVSSTGFRTMRIDSLHFRPERSDFNLGDILLQAGSLQLQDVIVYAEKPLVETKDGTLIFNVGESALSSAGSVTDLLKQTPLVTTDANGKVLVRGREPRILIDDKPIEMTLQQLQDLLESMPGNSIERIEVMTNPPPQFANEQGGVINIVTKKGKIGYGGRAQLNGGTRGEAGVSAGLTYRKQGLSINFNAGITENLFSGNGYSYRTNFFRDSSNQLLINNAYQNRNTRPNLRLTADYQWNKRNNIQAALQLNQNLYNNKSWNDYRHVNRFDETYRSSNRRITTGGNNASANFQATWTHKGKRAGEQLRMVTGYTVGAVSNERDFFEQFFRPPANPVTDSSQQQTNRNRNDNLSVQLAYDRSMGKKLKISTGGGLSLSHSDVNLSTLFLRKPDRVFVKNELLSNRFLFTQQVSNLRFSARLQLNQKIVASGGINTEATNIHFHFPENGKNVTNQYINWLPFMNLNYTGSRKATLQASYRRTIRRPGINELNPAIDYTDPYNIRYGNPDLLPTLAHTFDLVYGKTQTKYFFNLGIGYNEVQDIFSQIRNLQNDGKTVFTWDNVSNRREYEASSWGGLTLAKKLKLNGSATYLFNQYGSFDKTVRRFRDGANITTNFSVHYTPVDVWTFTFTGNFNRFANPQGSVRSNWLMNVGMQRKLFKKQVMLGFHMVDPIFQQQNQVRTFGSNFELESFSRTFTRNFRLVLSYQFNKTRTASKLALPAQRKPERN